MSEPLVIPEDQRACSICGGLFTPYKKKQMARCDPCIRVTHAKWMRDHWDEIKHTKKRPPIEQERKRMRTYLDNPETRRRKAEQQARYRRTPEYRQKFVARAQVTNALKFGTLIRGTCEVCGISKVDAHHDDYSKPLEVRWLCRTHHVEFHRQERIAANGKSRS